MTVETAPEELHSHVENEWPNPSLESHESIGTVFTRLVDSGKEYAHAEVNRQRLKASLIGSAAGQIAVLVGIGIMLSFASIVALLVGLIIALSPRLSPIGATAAVVVSALVIAMLFLLAAKSRVGRTKEALRS